MEEFPDDWMDCSDRCRETFSYGGQHDGNVKCFCYLCLAAITRPEFFRSAGCASYLSSLKVGHSRILEKRYGIQYGRYYYC